MRSAVTSEFNLASCRKRISQGMEDGRQRSEVGDQKSEVMGQEADVRSQRSEVTEGGGLMSNRSMHTHVKEV